MKPTKIKRFALLVVFLGVNNLYATELCFSCIGSSYVHATEKFEELKFENQQASICINDSNNKITHLSIGSDNVEGYLLTERHPETVGTQGYYYWESSGTYKNTRFNEELRIYVELSDIQYHLQVVHKNKSQNPRIAYNGRCQFSKRLNLK